MRELSELSLFSGAGGGCLGSKLLGHRTIGYVEYGDYPQRVIAARIKDGHLDDAPIFGDIRTFVSEGFARQYRGVVDIVTGGFPCQPFSVAGKRDAHNDERNMWPATRDVLYETKAPIFYGENVSGLLSAGKLDVGDGSGRYVPYFGTILSDLAGMGYEVKWGVLSAKDVGAYHQRKRLWLFCRNSEWLR
jgi:DNA (cytosine-5)-methyltransferase 1